MARVGWRTSRWPGSRPRAGDGPRRRVGQDRRLAPSGGPTGEGVVDGGGGRRLGRPAPPAQLVDGDVAPAAGRSGGGGWCDERRALPGQIVMVEDRRPAGQDLGRHLRRAARVERERAAGSPPPPGRPRSRASVELAPGRPGARLRWPGRGVVGRPGRHRPPCRWRIPSEAERPLPLGRLDRHAVGAAEAEGEEGGRRDGVTVAVAVRCGPTGPRADRAGAAGSRAGRCPMPAAPPLPPRAVRLRTPDDLLVDPDGAGPHADHQPARASQRHDLGGHRRLAPGGWPGPRTDPAVRVVVLAGAGDQAFCAGADLSGMVPQDPGGVTGRVRSTHHLARGWLAELFEELWHLGKPTIARVQGWAMAGGFGLALACDMVIASEQRPVRGPGAERGTVALHGDRSPCCAPCPQEGAGADADQPGGGGRARPSASAS